MHKLDLVSWGKQDLVTRQDLGLSPLRCGRLTRRSRWELHLINEVTKQVTRTSELVLISLVIEMHECFEQNIMKIRSSWQDGCRQWLAYDVSGNLGLKGLESRSIM